MTGGKPKIFSGMFGYSERSVLQETIFHLDDILHQLSNSMRVSKNITKKNNLISQTEIDMLYESQKNVKFIDIHIPMFSSIFQSYLLRFGVLGMFRGSSHTSSPGVWKPRGKSIFQSFLPLARSIWANLPFMTIGPEEGRPWIFNQTFCGSKHVWTNVDNVELTLTMHIYVYM